MSKENFIGAKLAIETVLNAGFSISTIAAFAELPISAVSFVEGCTNYEYNQGVDAVTPDIIKACQILAKHQFSFSLSFQSAYEAASALLAASDEDNDRRKRYQPAIDFLLSNTRYP